MCFVFWERWFWSEYIRVRCVHYTPAHPSSKKIVRKLGSFSQEAANPNDNDCANNGNDQAVNVEACHACFAERFHDEAANERTDNAQDNVPQQAAARTHDVRCHKASNCTEDNPEYDSHRVLINYSLMV